MHVAYSDSLFQLTIEKQNKTKIVLKGNQIIDYSDRVWRWTCYPIKRQVHYVPTGPASRGTGSRV